MKKNFIFTSLAVAAAMPALVAAQTTVTPGNLQGVSVFITNLLSFANNTLVPALFAIIFLYFAYAMFQIFVKGKGDSAALAAGTQQAINAVIGVVLILSFWGIVNLLAGGFGFTGTGQLNAPEIRSGRQ